MLNVILLLLMLFEDVREIRVLAYAVGVLILFPCTQVLALCFGYEAMILFTSSHTCVVCYTFMRILFET